MSREYVEAVGAVLGLTRLCLCLIEYGISLFCLSLSAAYYLGLMACAEWHGPICPYLCFRENAKSAKNAKSLILTLIQMGLSDSRT